LVELTQATSASTAVSPDAGLAPSGLLVFRATSRAWIRVSDSHGVVQFEKTLAAGESAVAPGVPPLAVIVGNVAATEVLLRGQPFALEPVTQNNVARFEVK
jgi:cytoskeleton protein RodZ